MQYIPSLATVSPGAGKRPSRSLACGVFFKGFPGETAREKEKRDNLSV